MNRPLASKLLSAVCACDLPTNESSLGAAVSLTPGSRRDLFRRGMPRLCWGGEKILMGCPGQGAPPGPRAPPGAVWRGGGGVGEAVVRREFGGVGGRRAPPW